MSQRIVFAALLLSTAVGLGGCKFLKKKAPDAEPTAAAAPSAAPPAPAVAPVPAAPEAAPVAALPPLDEATVPAPQDFEDEAFEKVTTANFKAELARLNKEITAPAGSLAR